MGLMRGLWFQADRTDNGYLTVSAGSGYRGLCAASRGWPHGADGAAATGHIVNVASITRRRAELAGWLRDLAKTPLLQ